VHGLHSTTPRHNKIVENGVSHGRRLPVGRVGRPDDVAAAVRYLGRRQRRLVTGQMLVLDGGGPAPFTLRTPEEEPA
jgi:NAD(P)-dependent dehydrogenase (short-subunit alcohol dehydrogenase family)